MTTIATARVGLHTYRLDRPMGGSGVAEVDVILCEIRDCDGATGFGFSYVIAGKGGFVADRAAGLAARFLSGAPLHPAPVHWRQIAASFNRTGTGANYVALAALDLALWDLHAVRQGVPLCTAMGGAARAVPVYGSGGFTPGMAPGAAIEAAEQHFDRGLAGVKPRISGVPADAAVLQSLAEATSGRGWLMADMNEKGTLSGAIWMRSLASDLGMRFIEEPLPALDMPGLRRLAAQPGAPIATGEHLQTLSDFATLASDGLASVLQPDLAMVGGLTPTLKITHLAEALGAEVMPHFLPSLFVHLAAVSPALTMLEEFPLLEPLFTTAPQVEQGRIAPLDTPGHGLVFDAARLQDTTWLEG